jgi:hypothetical protein
MIAACPRCNVASTCFVEHGPGAGGASAEPGFTVVGDGPARGVLIGFTAQTGCPASGGPASAHRTVTSVRQKLETVFRVCEVTGTELMSVTPPTLAS